MIDNIIGFRKQMVEFLDSGKKKKDFIFYVIYKDEVKKFIIDFKANSFSVIINIVMVHCLIMAVDNECDLEDLTVTTKGELIII